MFHATENNLFRECCEVIIGHNIGTTCVERMWRDERMLYSLRKKMGENLNMFHPFVIWMCLVVFFSHMQLRLPERSRVNSSFEFLNFACIIGLNSQ